MNDAPRVLIAVDKFKGCLRGSEVATHLRAGILETLPRAQVRLHPVSDGGDGFAGELATHRFVQHRVRAVDALGRPIHATFAKRGNDVVIEMALASGLQLIAPQDRDPLRADTLGLGMLLSAASRLDPRRIIIGAGGSATSDGGAGALAALGAALYDADEVPLRSFGPLTLQRVRRVDLTRLRRWRSIDLEVATDVTNPLLGPQGAAAIFAPQKGASPSEVDDVERALRHWANALEHATGETGRDRPGAGAAGGLGFGLNLGLGASIVDGLDTFATITGLTEAVSWSQIVITGEGSFDAQTTAGKAPSGVLRLARHAGRPCWVVAGRSELPEPHLRALGYAGLHTLLDRAPNHEASISRAPLWLREIGRELGKLAHAELTKNQSGIDVVRGG